MYENVITFDREVQYFWSGPLTGARVLFFANRYLPTLANAVLLMSYLPLTDEVSASGRLPRQLASHSTPEVRPMKACDYADRRLRTLS